MKFLGLNITRGDIMDSPEVHDRMRAMVAQQVTEAISNTEKRGLCSGIGLTYSGLRNYGTGGAMRLAAVYRCVDVISDSVAQLPLEPYRTDKDGFKVKMTSHPSWRILNKEPNKEMSRFMFMKVMVVSMLLRGNAFAFIERDARGNATSLTYIPSEKIIIRKDEAGHLFDYQYGGMSIAPRDMLHLINFTYDGITGVSTISNAINALHLASDSEAHAEGFFKSGANLAGILTVQGTLSKNQATEIKSAWLQAFSPEMGAANGVAVLPGNMQFSPITVNPAEAQLLETRQYSVIDICRFFGVSPVKCFDLSKSSYSTVEATQLAFLTDTLAPLLAKIELEIERKLFREDEKWAIDVRFDTTILLRADKSAQASYYNTMFNLGTMSINEIRREIDLPAINGGDNHFLQVNLQTLDKAISEPESTTEKESNM